MPIRDLRFHRNRGFSYRLMVNPGNGRCMSIPVPSLAALRDGIVDD